MATAFSRLLLATEHGEFDTGAEAVALTLARRCGLPLAAVLPVLSNPEFEAVAPQLAERADAEAAIRRQSLQALALAADVPLQVQVRRGAEPFAEIVNEARRHGADLLIIRRRGKRGLLAKLLVGEMVSKVVAQSPCSVLVAPQGAQMWARGVLVCVDPQAPDATLQSVATTLASECALPLHLHLHALAAGTDAQAAAQQVLTAARAQGADLIMLGRDSGSRPGRAWAGAVTQKVIGLAECPVLVHVNPTPPPSS